MDSEPGNVAAPDPTPAPRTGPRTARRLLLAVVILVVVLALPALVAGVVAYRNLKRSEVNLLAARRDLGALKPAAADADLQRAGPELARATSWLTSVATLPARLVPGVRGNIEVATALARSGSQVVAAGRQSVDVLDALGVGSGKVSTLFKGGTVNLSLLQRAAPAAASVQASLATAQRLAQSNYSLLLPQIRHARGQALKDLLIARKQADAAQAATSVLPNALGAHGPRTWLVAAANTDEERGRTGYLGAFAVVPVDRGTIDLHAFQGNETLPPLATAFTGPDVPIEYQKHYRLLGGLDAWANLTMSPSFPDGAKLLLSRMAASGGPVAGGIVELDPTALSYLMQVTGPVQVAGIPVPITASNVVAWSLNLLYSYDASSTNVRKATLSDIAQAVWQKILAGGANPVTLAKAFGRGIREGRLFIYSSDPTEEATFSSLGIAGSVAQGPGDYLMVLTQNLGENKMDYYMKRRISYDATLSADGSMQVRLTVILHNTAPPGQRLDPTIGGARPHLRLAAGTDRSYLSAFVPAGAVLSRVTIGGVPAAPNNLDNGVELGKHYFATVVDVGQGVSTPVVFSYRVPKVLVAGHYQLTIQDQATVHPDQLSVHVVMPRALSVAGSPGIQPDGNLVWAGTPLADLQLGQDPPRS